MKTINWKKMSVKEIGALICHHLNKNGFDSTLTGGACVSIYSNNKYQSEDLDFVTPTYDMTKFDAVIEELGFKRTKGHRHYINPNCPYYVEFPPTPLSIGAEVVLKVAQYKCKYGILKLLTPTDSVKDRLAAYYHWNDQQSLEQALLVATIQKIDMKNVEKWSKGEENIEKFREFKKLLDYRKTSVSEEPGS